MYKIIMCIIACYSFKSSWTHNSSMEFKCVGQFYQNPTVQWLKWLQYHTWSQCLKINVTNEHPFYCIHVVSMFHWKINSLLAIKNNSPIFLNCLSTWMKRWRKNWNTSDKSSKKIFSPWYYLWPHWELSWLFCMLFSWEQSASLF